MDLLNEPLFKALFNTRVPRLILKGNVPHYTIVAYNEAFAASTYILERDVTGLSLWEAYDPDQAAGDGAELVPPALAEAAATGKTIDMPGYRYDVVSPDGNSTIPSWWQIEIAPIGHADGHSDFLVLTTQDITEKVAKQKEIADGLLREQDLGEELASTNEELLSANEELTSSVEELRRSKNSLKDLNDQLEERVVTRTNQLFMANFRTEKERARLETVINTIPAGLCILTGKDLVIEMVNDGVLKLWNRDNSIVGKPLVEAFPELKKQEFPKILNKVFTTGITHEGTEGNVEYIVDGVAQSRYRDFSYIALRNELGEVDSILILSVDVTDRVLARNREQQLVEEVAATNEELSSANEELLAVNEEMLLSQRELQAINKIAKTNETTLKQAIETAYIGTWTADLVTDMLNISERARIMHGIAKGAKITLAESLKMIVEQHRLKIKEAIEEAILMGNSFEEEYIINPLDNSKPRWLRSTGRANYDDKGTAISITGTILDITEQKEDEQRKNDFIGMVSHELKTPLTSLKAFVQMLNLKAQKEGDSFATGSLNKIEIQVNKMGTMINGFLNLSRLESGKIVLEKQKFNFDELLSEVVAETTIVTASHTITILPGDTNVPVDADRDKIGHVISNLLSNAVKYSPRGKNIDVKCEITGYMAQISVKDDGMGIKPQDVARLFERYYRVETKHTENISGFGIGLYLSAEIVRRHEGKIWVESQSGVGSTFKFTIPLDH